MPRSVTVYVGPPPAGVEATRTYPAPITAAAALARPDVTDVNGTFTTRYEDDVATVDHTYDMRDGVFEGYFDRDAVYEQGEFAAGGFPQVAATGTPYEAGSNNTTHLVNCPAHNAGDRLLLLMCFDGSAHAVSSISPVGGDAWTQVFDATNNQHTRVYEIVERGSGGSSQDVTVTLDASEAGAAAIVVVEDHNTGQAAEVGAQTSTSSTPNPPTMQPSWGAANNLWIAFAGWDDGTVSCSAGPTDYTGFATARANLTAGAGLAWAFHEENNSQENPSAFTLSASENWVAGTVAVRSAGGTTAHQKNTSMIRVGESNRPDGVAVVGGKAYGQQPTTLTWERMKNGQQVQDDVDSHIDTGVPADEYVNQTTNMDGDTLRVFVAQADGWVLVAGRRSYNSMDGMQVNGLDASGTTGAGRVFYENCWIRRSRDDGIESDDMNGVHLWDCFIDGSFGVVSVSPGTTAPRGTTQSPHDVSIESSVIRLEALPGGHKLHSTDTTHGKVFKTESNGPADGNGETWGFSPRLHIRDTVIATERWADPDRSMLPERVDIDGVPGWDDTYENVYLCWLGVGAYPGNVPSGCTLLTGSEASSKIANAAADWKSRHGVTDFDTVDQAQMLTPTPPTVP